LQGSSVGEDLNEWVELAGLAQRVWLTHRGSVIGAFAAGQLRTVAIDLVLPDRDVLFDLLAEVAGEAADQGAALRDREHVEALAAVVRVADGEPLDHDAVIGHCGRFLPAYMVPDAIVPVGELPRGSRGKADYQAVLDQIARERTLAEDARARALKEAAEAATLKVRARGLLREAENKHREVWENAQSAAEQELADLRREAHRVRLQLQAARSAGVPESAREAIESALTLPGMTMPPAPLVPRAEEPDLREAARIQPGSEVMVPRLGLPGRVVAIRDDSVEVEVLGRRVRMPLRELEGATRPTSAERRAAQPERLPTIAVASPRGEVPYQLDLRGLRRDEALERLEQYLEDASLIGLPEARIVHGKGTGAIRQAVRDTLRRSRYVARFTPEPDSNGGDGATQVWLK